MSDKPYQFQPWNPWWPWRPPWSRSIETIFRDAIAKVATDQSIEDVERANHYTPSKSKEVRYESNGNVYG